MIMAGAIVGFRISMLIIGRQNAGKHPIKIQGQGRSMRETERKRGDIQS